MTLSPSRAFIDSTGRPTQEFWAEFKRMQDLTMKVGFGTPEGVVEGVDGAIYTDLDASAGSRIYSKSGAGKTGWEVLA